MHSHFSSPRFYPGKSRRAILIWWLALALVTAVHSSRATDGTWTNASSNSTWGNTSNWASGTVASGLDAIADFSTLDISAARTVNLGANFTAGTLIFGDATTPSSNWTLANGTGGPWNLTLATSTGTPIINIVNQTTTISAALGGAQGFIKSGAGTLTLTGTNTLQGGINLSAGVLNFASGSLGNNLVDFTATATLGWNGANTQDISAQIKIEDGVTATLNTGANNVTFTSVLQTGAAGTGALTKTGAGTLTITAANTYSGLTKVSVGRIVLSAGDNRLAVTGTIGLGQGANSGVLQLGDATGASNQTTTSLTIAGTGTANAIVGGSTEISTLTVNNSANDTYAGLLGGTGTNENNLALVKSGTTTLTLSNDGNTFTGDINITGGTLAITKSGALGAGAKTITISGTATAPSFKLNGSSGDLTLGSNFSFITSNNNVGTPAIVSSAGNNTINGNITLTSGGFGNGQTRISVTADTLTLNGGIAPDAGAASARTLFLDGTGSGIVNGVISNTGTLKLAITKQGTGTWTLTAANSYTGATTVSVGTLLADNVSGSATGGTTITVSTGGTLGGTGTIGATGPAAAPHLTLNTGGTLMVGDTHGIAALQGSTLTLKTSGAGQIVIGGTVLFDILGRVDGGGDLIVPTNTNDELVIYSSSAMTFNTGAILQVSDPNGIASTFAAGDAWKLIDWSNVMTPQANVGIIGSFDLPTLANGLAWNTSHLYDTGVISIDAIAAPEPGRATLLLTAGMMVVLQRRRTFA